MQPITAPVRTIARTPQIVTATLGAGPSIRTALLFALLICACACIDQHTAQRAIEGIQAANGQTPDQMPVMLNREPPFRYPLALYANKVQGNVTLHLRIDTTGAVIPESTTVAESSGYPSLDSAALKGSEELRFSPARLHGTPLAVSFFLPVFFRHPQGRPLPGDTILHERNAHQPPPSTRHAPTH